MLTYIIYALVFGAITNFFPTNTYTAVALLSFLYVTLVFWNSKEVGIWYGIPFRYHPDDHTVLHLLSYQIYHPRFIVVNGLGHH